MFRKLKQKVKSVSAFTLAELLIVVAIIGVLTAIAIPVFSSQLEKSREATDIANLRSAKAAAVAKYLSDDLIDGTFYFDAKKGTLLAAADFTPGCIQGYGKGTDKTGNVSNIFDIGAVAEGAISMSWVDTDGASNENTANYAANSVVTDQIIKIVFDSDAADTGGPIVPPDDTDNTTEDIDNELPETICEGGHENHAEFIQGEYKYVFCDKYDRISVDEAAKVKYMPWAYYQ